MVFWVILTIDKTAIKLKQTWKEYLTKIQKHEEVIINYNGASMVKDGEDWHRLQMTNLKYLG